MKKKILVVIFCMLINNNFISGSDVDFGEGIKINDISELNGIWEARVQFSLFVPPRPPLPPRLGLVIFDISKIKFSFSPLPEEDNNLYKYKMILDFEPMLEYLMMKFLTNNDLRYSKDELWEIVITQMIKKDNIDDRFYIEKYSINLLLTTKNIDTKIDMYYHSENNFILLLPENRFPDVFHFGVIFLHRIL